MVDRQEEQINLDLRTHQMSLQDWDKRRLLEDLHTRAEEFKREFKLAITVPALMLECLSPRCYGHFRLGRNGFGLLDEIAINETYVGREPWQLYATLLHELLHAERENTRDSEDKPGRRSGHDRIFRDRAQALGLVVDRWGHTQVAPPPSPFWNVLREHGIEPPKVAEPLHFTHRQRGTSKLKLWICRCEKPVRVRVAVADFQARCLKCGQLFIRTDTSHPR